MGERQYPLYVYKGEKGTFYLAAVRGNGLWDKIYNFKCKFVQEPRYSTYVPSSSSDNAQAFKLHFSKFQEFVKEAAKSSIQKINLSEKQECRAQLLTIKKRSRIVQNENVHYFVLGFNLGWCRQYSNTITKPDIA